MSEFSDSSQNYHSIITNMLSFKKQWSQVPEVVYLTVKAIHNHSEQLEENIYRQREIITEQSVKLRELQFQFQAQSPNKKQPSFEPASHAKSSRFNKEKKRVPFLHQTESNRTRKSQASPENGRENSSFDKGLDKTMVEEVKALAEAIIDKSNKKLHSQIEKLKQGLEEQRQSIKQIVAQEKQGRQENAYPLEIKLNELQVKISRKIQLQRTNLMKFAEQSAIEMEKVLIQINNINLRMSQLEEKRPIYPLVNTIGMKTGSVVQTKQNNEGKLADKVGVLAKDFSEFKIKIMKEMTQFMKTEAIENIVSRFQADTSEKISKLVLETKNISKVMDSQLKEAINKNESKLLTPSLPQQNERKKNNSSHKSLAIIQESLQKLQGHFKQKLKSMKKELLAQMSTTIEREQILAKKQIRQQMEEREKALCDVVQSNCDRLMKNQQKEKFLTGSNIERAIQSLSQQMILSRYLHLGEKNSKEFIEWEKNACNLMEENYVWKQHSHIVMIMAAGLYRVEAGLYSDNEGDEISAFFVLNGMPISSFKNKELLANSKAPARGSLFNEALLLPAKSRIWIKTEVPFFGQAYLQILKL